MELLLSQLRKYWRLRIYCKLVAHKWIGDNHWMSEGDNTDGWMDRKAIREYIMHDPGFPTVYCKKCGYITSVDQKNEKAEYLDVEARRKMIYAMMEDE